MSKIKYLSGKYNGQLNFAIFLNALVFVFRGIPFIFLFLIVGELFNTPVDGNKILIYSIGMFIVLLINLFIVVKAQDRLFRTAFNISSDIRIRLGEHLRKLSLGFFKKHDPADITAPILQDMQNVETIFSNLYPDIIASIVTPLTISIVFFFVDLRLALIALLFVLISVPVLLQGQKIIKKYGHKIFNLRTGLCSMMLEYFYGMKVVKSYNMAGDKFTRLENVMDNFRKDSINLQAFSAPLVLGFILVLDFGFIAVLTGGMFFFLKGVITLPVLLIFLLIGNRFFELLQGVGIFASEFRYMNVGAERIQKVFQHPEIVETDRHEEVESYDIEYKNVSFSYHDKEVLKDVSFKAPSRSLTALVGPSGSGKTTITNLLARFWDIDKGQICIGGIDIRNLKTDYLLSQISMIFQDVFLFNDTIYNNIKIGNPDATREEIIAAAEAACCHEFISNLPDGYNSLAGEAGAKLSGGEKQRVSIARAILKNAPIVILDEATSSLDPENEHSIQNAINSLIRDKTLLVIAHRLTTIRHADQILVLDDGRIVESGKHEQLLTTGGIYKNFWEQQTQVRSWSFGKKE